MRYILFLIVCLVLCSSCGRSGRKNRNKTNKQNYEQTTTSKRQIEEPSSNVGKNIPHSRASQRQNKSSASADSNSRKYTGNEIFKKFNSAVFKIHTSNGDSGFQGSGFFITSNGIAVSNYHVFQGTYVGLEKIILSDGQVLSVEEVIAKSQENDFIIFKVDNTNKENFSYIPLSKHTAEVGDKVYAIGSPRGLDNTFSSGEVSQIREENIILISVPIDHGSSGGALINQYGEVIGITSGGIDESGANLNFAIDIDVIRPYVKSLVR